jgi:organic radical activating enzyme
MEKQSIVLSLNPSYFCNFRCNFCYLSKDQLGDSTRLSLERLFAMLTEVSAHYQIAHVDLYGGEVLMLPRKYLEELLRILRIFYQEPVNIITNLSVNSPVYLREDIDLTVSWDFEAREQHQSVYQRMQKLEKPFHILSLASEKLLRMDDAALDRFIHALNDLPALSTFEIKPFSQNPHHPQSLRFDEFEAFVQRWFLRSSTMRFEFINKKRIRESLAKTYTSWSDNHLYLTPQGKFAVLDFDSRGREFFLDLPDVPAYWRWTQSEKRKVSANSYCSKCEFLGHCLSEHLQEVQSLENSCNGFKNLLTWAQQNPSYLMDSSSRP